MAMMNNKAVYCIAKNVPQAEHIVDQLKSSGFKDSDISVLFPEGSTTAGKGQWDKSWDKSADVRPVERDVEGRATDFDAKRQVNTTNTAADAHGGKQPGGLVHELHSKAPEGASTGTLTGGIIGGTLGLLAGIGALAIPGLGPFVAAGPILGALAGTGLGGGIGLLIGALVGLGIPEYEAVYYAEKLKNKDNILVCVHTNSSEEIDKAKGIFEKNGAEDIAYSKEASAPRKDKW